MLVADAGFVGYDLMSGLIKAGGDFLIRVGRNAYLLEKLGYAKRERAGVVYLWPQKHQRGHQPPLVLRLIQVKSKGQTIYLLTNLTNRRALTQKQAGRIYRLRWGVEVWFRSLKQTLSQHKMLSRTPANAALELRWVVVSLWLLRWLQARAIAAKGGDPARASDAGGLRVLRGHLRELPGVSRAGGLMGQLASALKDTYQRVGSKQSYNWPHKKNESHPKAPRRRAANAREILKAKEIKQAGRGS